MSESGCGLPVEYSARISSALSARPNKQNSSIAPPKFRIMKGSFFGNPLAFQLPNSAAPTRNGGLMVQCMLTLGIAINIMDNLLAASVDHDGQMHPEAELVEGQRWRTDAELVIARFGPDRS
jgi:hypothetical protein